MISDASVFGKLNEPLFYDTKRSLFSAERNVLPWEQIEMILLILSLSVRVLDQTRQNLRGIGKDSFRRAPVLIPFELAEHLIFCSIIKCRFFRRPKS